MMRFLKASGVPKCALSIFQGVSGFPRGRVRRIGPYVFARAHICVIGQTPFTRFLFGIWIDGQYSQYGENGQYRTNLLHNVPLRSRFVRCH